MNFKPMPWLTVFTILGVALLLKLGFWQKDRLEWKTELLERVEAAAEAPAFESVADIKQALAQNDPVDFRRYRFTINSTNTPFYWVYAPEGGRIEWYPFARVIQSGNTVYFRGPRIDDEERDAVEHVPPSEFESSGYVRLAAPLPSRFGKLIKTKPNPDANRWFSFNQDDLWIDDGVMMSFWLDSRIEAQFQDLPPLRPDIPNNHRDYMWTWFSFAGLLLLFYALIHRRAGRLSWG